MPFSPIPDVLADLRAGKMVVLTDDETRENEGDLILPAQFVTPEAITFMLQNALGYLCLCLTEADCDRLHLHPQSSINTSVRGTAFTISIDLHPRFGGTTGVSAKERAKCIQMAIDPKFGPDDFTRPGHVNPLRSRDGGVLVRAGQTEGSVDLCRLAGLHPSAVLLEIMKPDGEMARVPDLEKFCAQHSLKMCSVAQVIEHRLKRETLVRRAEPFAGVPLSTSYGQFQLFTYHSVVDRLPHIAICMGGVGTKDNSSDVPTLVRMHRRQLLGDVFEAIEEAKPASGSVLRASMRAIAKEGRGAIVYLRPADYALEQTDLESTLQRPVSTHPAETLSPAITHESASGALREFGVGGQILRDLGLRSLRLLTTSNRPIPGLEAFDIRVVDRLDPRTAADF